MNQQTKPGNRRPLIAMVLLFVGPLVLAWVLYFTGVWRPAGQAHHGTLVEPAINVAEQLESQETLLTEQWSLLQVVTGSCDAACIELEERLGQVRLALGHRRDRVRRVLLWLGQADPSVSFEDPALNLLTVDSNGVFAKSFEANKLASLDTSVFLVDPIGNLVMVYPADVEQRALLEDLKRLLRLSRIG